MTEFLAAVQSEPFLRHALAAGVLASVACGVVGSYVVVRRMTYLAGGISHCVLGGMGLAMYMNKVHGISWASPMLGAVCSALAAALIIGLVSIRYRQREDTVISALWAVGMAAGVLFVAKTPGYQQDLMSYLFGNILMVSSKDLWIIAALDAGVLALTLAFYKELLAVSFDEEYATTRGIRVEFYYLLLLCMTALTVVLLVTVVGIVMVIALLTLPTAIAGQFAGRLWKMMALSAVLISLFTFSGLALSYSPDLPPGAFTIVLAGGVYLAVLLVKSLKARLSGGRSGGAGA